MAGFFCISLILNDYNLSAYYVVRFMLSGLLKAKRGKGWASDWLIVGAVASYMLGKRIALLVKPVT